MSGELVPAEGLPSAPDILGEVLGFRTWASDIDGQALHSAHGSWQPGINQMTCAQHRTHTKPTKMCGCGFYAYHDLNGFEENGTYGDIFGAVVGWGKLRVARDGFRAQYAQVVALSPGPFQGEKAEARDHWSRCEKLAERYGVECVVFDKLEEFALQFAEPVPISHRPGRPAGKRALPTPIPQVGPAPPPDPVIHHHHRPYVQRQFGEYSTLAALASVTGVVAIGFTVFEIAVHGLDAVSAIALVIALALTSWGYWYERGT